MSWKQFPRIVSNPVFCDGKEKQQMAGIQALENLAAEGQSCANYFDRNLVCGGVVFILCGLPQDPLQSQHSIPMDFCGVFHIGGRILQSHCASPFWGPGAVIAWFMVLQLFISAHSRECFFLGLLAHNLRKCLLT